MSEEQNKDFNPSVLVEEVDYDRHEARAGLIAGVSLGVIGLLVVMIVGIYWFYTFAYERTEYEQYTGVSSKELQAIHDREEEQLHRYSFIDKEKGVVRIPIDRAMELVAADFAAGKVGYNTTSYPVKQELPGGAAGGANPPAPGQPGVSAAPGQAAPAAPAAEAHGEAPAKH